MAAASRSRSTGQSWSIITSFSALPKPSRHVGWIEVAVGSHPSGTSQNILEFLSTLRTGGHRETYHSILCREWCGGRIEHGVGLCSEPFGTCGITLPAAERLRKLPDGRVEATGMVTKLSRAEGDAGDVVITGDVRIDQWAAEQKVKVRLRRELYDRAVQAHQHQRMVSLIGVASGGR